VIVPSRGRPDNIAELWECWQTTGANATLVVVVDKDDPEVINTRYLKQYGEYGIVIGDHANMADALNKTAVDLARSENYNYIGFMGDDHRPRTANWDRKIIESMDSKHLAIDYANDLYQGPNLPTQVFMSDEIIRALGWMALPGAKHMYLDNTWLVLGRALDCLTYHPEITIEHLHPVAGKAEWDDGYKRVNDAGVYQHDLDIFNSWVNLHLRTDVDRIRAYLGDRQAELPDNRISGIRRPALRGVSSRDL
jgi:hypothetical protein